ncbi:hypothetical protein GCM10009113_10210 [Marinobacter szutsaonensis]
MGLAFQNCAEPWMAELKRHMDVPKERVLESQAHTGASTQSLNLTGTPDSEDNHHRYH